MESYYNELAKKIKEIDSEDLKRMDEEIRKIGSDHQISVDEYIQKVEGRLWISKSKQTTI